MNFERDFVPVIKRLQTAFGKGLTDDQADLWFEKVKAWSGFKFSKIVESIIDEGDRFPTIGHMLKRGYDFVDAIPQNQRTECQFCEGRGTIVAVKDSYDTCFRCPQCENWQGRFSEAIPRWSSEWRERGYRVKVALWDMSEVSDEALQVLASSCPALFATMAKKNPELLGKIKKEKVDQSKEFERKRSLEKEIERESLVS